MELKPYAILIPNRSRLAKGQRPVRFVAILKQNCWRCSARKIMLRCAAPPSISRHLMLQILRGAAPILTICSEPIKHKKIPNFSGLKNSGFVILKPAFGYIHAYTLPGINVSSAISSMPAKTTQRTPAGIVVSLAFSSRLKYMAMMILK